jgi:nicotinate-nucleotide--dimethylbenzimidazole phosphoribosyltransferase
VAAGPDPVAAAAHPPRPPIPIAAVDGAARAAVAARLRAVAGPPGAVGRLEELAVWLAGVTGKERPEVRARVVVAAADHGAGAGARPAAAPRLAAAAEGRAAVCALARADGSGLVLVDAGVRDAGRHDGVVPAGIAPARDVAVEPALSVGEVAAAVDCGRDLAAAAARDGVTVLAGGAIGPGATTAATCLAAALTGADPAALAVGGAGQDGAARGREREPEGAIAAAAGLDCSARERGRASAAADGLGGPAQERERAIVAAAVARHAPQARGPLGLLRRLGGGDLCVLCGLALGAGEHGLGFVCDGPAATAAAAVAVAVEPDLRGRLLAADRSGEPGHAALLEHLGLDPLLGLDIRAGDGTGAVAAISLLRLAAALA